MPLTIFPAGFLFQKGYQQKQDRLDTIFYILNLRAAKEKLLKKDTNFYILYSIEVSCEYLLS
jgi:hypothetical protein